MKPNFPINPYHITKEGKASLQEQFRKALEQGSKFKDICESSPVSRTTTYRWIHQDMSPIAQANRKEHPRRKKLLTEEESQKVVQIASEMRNKRLAVTQEVTRKIIAEVTQCRISNASSAFISRFWKEKGWPNRKVQARNKKEVRDSLEIEVENFRDEVMQYVNEHNIPPSMIYAMDETGLWNGAVAPKTYCDPSTMDSSVISEGDHKRDTGVVAVSASGCVNPYFISHVPQRTRTINGKKEIIQKRVSGMGIEQMKGWVEDFGQKVSNNEKTILLCDRLAAHCNKEIVQKMENEHNIKVFHFPPQGAKISSVCDNSLFSVVKSRMTKSDTSSTDKKRTLFEKICHEFEPEIVKNFWKHCGWPFE